VGGWVGVGGWVVVVVSGGGIRPAGNAMPRGEGDTRLGTFTTHEHPSQAPKAIDTGTVHRPLPPPHHPQLFLAPRAPTCASSGVMKKSRQVFISTSSGVMPVNFM
jgi:hypothetical protein